MATSLLETFKTQISDSLVKLLSDFTNEQPSVTRTAVERAGEATLAGLINRGSTQDGSNSLAKVLHNAKFDGDVLTELTNSVRNAGTPANLIDQGKTLLSSLFGDRTDGLAQWISKASGIGQTSGLSLLSLIAPVMLGFIKRQFGANPDGAGLRTYLDGQRGFLEKIAPAGLLSVLGWQGWGAAPATVKVPTQEARPAPVVVADPPQRSAFPWPWLLGLLGLLLLGFLLMRGCNRVEDTAVRTPTTAPVTTTAPVAPRKETVVVTTPSAVELVLRDKAKLMVMPGSIEQRLVAFIEDTTKVPDDKTWFTFDGLEFETGSANLKPSSLERLKQIAAILKAYPSVNIKIGGYTDNVGDPQTNLKISGERAKSTLQQLVGMGIAANRMDAEGYGEQYPVADNTTEQGRQKNRRVDVRVTAK